MKKRLLFTAALFAVLVAAAGCGTTIPMGDESSLASISSSDVASYVESSDIRAESAVISVEESLPHEKSYESEAEESSLPSHSEEESSEAPSSREESSEASTATSAAVSNEPSNQPEESSEEESSEPSQPTVGNLFSSYHRILKSGKYMLKTVESKIVGGEAMPYTTTVYHDGKTVYITIEESYGATSELLIKDGSTYWLDSISKQAIRTVGTSGLDAERTLYADGLKYLRNEKYKFFDTEYTCEVYTDSRGREFSFGFSSFGELKLYRFYDAAKKDVITINIDISANITSGQFDVPDGYTVIG